MTDSQSTNTARAASRTSDVRAHERAQYATPPTLPTVPTVKTLPESPNARMPGFADAREEPGNPDHNSIPDDTANWLIGYRRDRISGTVTLLRLSPPLTEVFRGKPWATLIRDQGWAIPLRYLAHVERLLTGTNVTLFDIDGAPTPAQRERDRADEHHANRQVLDDIHAARDAAQRDPAAVERARREARAAFEQATARQRDSVHDSGVDVEDGPTTGTPA